MFILREFKNDSDIITKSLSGSKQSNTSDNAHDSKKKCGAWAKVRGEQPHFPFSGQPDTNIGLAHPNNEPEYFELSITPQIIEPISIETTHNAQHFLENMPN